MCPYLIVFSIFLFVACAHACGGNLVFMPSLRAPAKSLRICIASLCFVSLQLFVSSAYGVLNITLNPICSCNCTSQSEVVNLSLEAYHSLWFGSIFPAGGGPGPLIVPYFYNLAISYATSALSLPLTKSLDHSHRPVFISHNCTILRGHSLLLVFKCKKEWSII